MGVSSNRVEDLSGFTCPETVHTTVVIVPTSSEPQIAVMPPPTQQLPTVDELVVHKVCMPPARSTLKKLKQRLADVFFPDDPLHHCLNRGPFQKLLLTLHFFFPIFKWASEYNRSLLRSDLVSGLTIASLAIPQGISYAKLANLPPIIGLYSSFVPPLIYSLLGSSRHVAVGPVSIASLVMGTMLGEAVSLADEPILYLKLAFTATFFAGVFQASLGLLRLGFLIDFLSRATLIGFTSGAAVIVSLQQLKGLLGMVHFTSKMQIIPVLSSVLEHNEEWQWQTMFMGFGFLIFLLATRQFSAKNKQYFWVSAAAPLTTVFLSTIIVYAVKPSARQVPIIGDLPKGLNPPSLNMLFFSGCHLALAIKTGIITGILSLTEGIAVGRTFAAMKNYQVDGNKEMVAIGVMNMVGSCSSCYVTTGSFSRTAINHQAGGQTALSNVVMASSVLVTLLFLMPLFHYTPNLILSAIIITAVIGLIDYQFAFNLWKVDKLDFVACLSSFFGVLFYSVPMGLAISVGISVFKILLHVTRPNTMILGRLPGTMVYHNLGRYRDASRIPSFLIIAVESPIYFANVTYLQERILRWVREEEGHVRENNESAIKSVILDLTAVTAIDTSGIHLLRELRKTLDDRSLQLVLTNPAGNVMEKLHKSETLESFGAHGLYLTVAEAVMDITTRAATTTTTTTATTSLLLITSQC